MPTSLIQPSFAGGELAPSLQGRVDISRYAISLKTCRNFYVLPYGGASNRSGFKLNAETKFPDKFCRLIPFTFSSEITYVIELGDRYARFYRDGIQLQSGGAPYEIQSPYAEADLALVKFVQSADVLTVLHPDYKVREIRRFGDTDWQFSQYSPEFGPFQDQNVNRTLVITSNGVENDVTLECSADLFSSEMVGTTIRLEQETTGDVAAWTNRASVAVGDIRFVGERMYECTELAAADAITGDQTPVHTAGEAWDGPKTTIQGVTNVLGAKWRYLHSGWGVVRVDAINNARSATCRVLRRLPDNIAGSFGASQSLSLDGSTVQSTISIPGATSPRPEDYTVSYRIDENIGTLEDLRYVLIYAKGTNVISPSRYTVDLANELIRLDDSIYGSDAQSGQYLRVAYQAGGSGTYRFRLSAWNTVRGYPATATYAEQRLVFAGSVAEPQTIWFSETGVFNGYTTNIPVEADDAITITIASRQINQVRHLVPLNRLLALTTGAEWVIGPNGDAGLAPDNISASAQNYRGASDVRPLLIGATALYVQGGGQIVRDLSYSFDIDGYTGSDLTIFSNHLFNGRRIVDWCFAQEPDSVLWVVMDDGALLSLTYVREQEMVAWARHDSLRGQFEAIASIREGSEDGVYAVVKRTRPDGTVTRFVERMASREFNSISDAFFVDSGLTYDGRATDGSTVTTAAVETGDDKWKYPNRITLTFSADQTLAVDDKVQLVAPDDPDKSYDDLERLTVTITAVTSATVYEGRPESIVPEELRDATTGNWAKMATTLSGLGHLEGERVSVLADGNVERELLVSGGSITLQYPAAVAHAGLPIVSDLETLPISSQGETVRDAKKMVTGVGLLLDKSRGVFAGRSKNTLEPQFYNLQELKQRNDEDWGETTQLLTGYARLAIAGKWDRSANVFIRQEDPLPLSILAIIPEVTVGGKG